MPSQVAKFSNARCGCLVLQSDSVSLRVCCGMQASPWLCIFTTLSILFGTPHHLLAIAAERQMAFRTHTTIGIISHLLSG